MPGGEAPETLGARIAELRSQRGWSLRATARRLGWSSHSQLSEIERGKRSLPADRIADVARLFGVDRAALEALPNSGTAAARAVNRDGHHLPPRRTGFIDRRAALDRLATELANGAGIAILCGLGGVGKTELALEFAHRAPGYATRWWINATDAINVREQHERLTEALADRRGTALIVLDDTDDPAAVMAFLPRDDSVHVIVTTRSRSWETVAPLVDLAPFSREEALELLLERLPESAPEEALELADRLGCLPLALAQASNYARLAGLSIAGYADLLGRHPGVLGRGTADGYAGSAATTWDLSLRAAVADTAARQWLAMVAYLAPAAIPLRLFIEYVDRLPPAIAAVIRDEGIDALTAPFVARSLLAVEGDTGRMHPLVLEAFRAMLAPDEVAAAVRADLDLIGEESGDDEVWGVLEWTAPPDLVPSILTLAANPEALASDPQKVLRGLYSAAVYVNSLGRLVDSLAIVERAQNALAAHRVVDPLLVFDVENLAGGCLGRLLQLDAAEEAFDRARVAIEPVAAQNPKRAALVAMNLAVVAAHRGDGARAAEMLEACLRHNEALLGTEHEGLASVLANLTAAYILCGRNDDAVVAARRGLRIADTDPATPSPFIEALIVNLGIALLRSGDLTGALDELNRVIDRITAARGTPAHLKLLEPLVTRAEVFRQLGRIDDAAADAHKATTLAEQLDAPAPVLAEALFVAAKIERDKGRPKAARRLGQQAEQRLDPLPPGATELLQEVRELLGTVS